MTQSEGPRAPRPSQRAAAQREASSGGGQTPCERDDEVRAALRLSGLHTVDVSRDDTENYPPAVTEAPSRQTGGASPLSDRADANTELSQWADIVGPCYTVTSLSGVLRLPGTAILEAASELRVLRLRTADGNDLFPSFQVRDGRVHPNLQIVLKALQDGIDDPWTWAQWLNTPDSCGVAAMQRLWAGHLSDVLSDAAHDAWAWRT